MANRRRAKVLGAELIRKRLDRMVRNSRGTVGSDMDLIASDLLERAANLAPVLTGDLIRSGRILRRPGRNIRRIVSFGTDHAIFTHEGHYNLGMISRQKPATEDGKVGRKYLSRPLVRNQKAYIQLVARRQALRLARDAARS